ncbi:hypothetical protein SteCoe_12388 [Stentor coeruleus]|uniref:Uncharacterized protein n=1 Tax=Stentor coeruleus TaxID=5963 RepID=A0A1R2CB37_9CILI|nr:hypothetical protein SteCoe_12388 [Stentor coeruleus]
MSKLTVYLLLIIISAILINPDSLPNEISIISIFEDKKILKVPFMCLIVILGTYFIFTFLKEKPKILTGPYFAQKISKQEFENHKLLYTQQKLYELYQSRAYKNLQKKKLNQPCMPYEYITFSDEED